MTKSSQDRGTLDIGSSSLSFMTDFLTLTYVSKVAQAVPVAVFSSEQEVTMNECVHRELYLYVQAVSHEMTG